MRSHSSENLKKDLVPGYLIEHFAQKEYIDI
jgi:hypothetical protein